MDFNLTHDAHRLVWAAGTAAAFGTVCLLSLWPRKTSADAAEYLVLYASQTGQAEDLAHQAQAQLSAAGLNAAVSSLAQVTGAQLQSARYILCVAATTGEGEAPDEARSFEKRVMATPLDLSRQSFAVLALGDRKYAQFAAFGRRLHDWFSACGAGAISPCLTADDLDAATLNTWAEVLQGLGAINEPLGDDLYLPWRLQSRERLNPQGETALYRLRLAPQTGDLPDWEAGDLAEIITPDGHRRDYSIASLTAEGHLELYVREVCTPEGVPGTGSGLLIHTLAVGENINLRLKSHHGFHAPEGNGPVLLIGAGSGLAGLRAHIVEMRGQRRGWLVYGERNPVRDAALIQDLLTWREDGGLNDLDLAFSQPDDGPGRYVQDILDTRAADVRRFLSTDGAIMVCGGLAMGRAVESTLRRSLGDNWIEAAMSQGRFRRDLY